MCVPGSGVEAESDRVDELSGHLERVSEEFTSVAHLTFLGVEVVSDMWLSKQ